MRFTEMKLSDIQEFAQFNKTGMTIIIPDKGNNPSNPNAKLVRDFGCQFLAMRYQLNDKNFFIILPFCPPAFFLFTFLLRTCLFKATRNIIIFQGFFLLYNKNIPNIKYLEYFS